MFQGGLPVKNPWKTSDVVSNRTTLLRAGNFLFQFQLSHNNIPTNKFAFFLCFLVLYCSLQGKMAECRMFKSFHEVKNIVECSIVRHRTLTHAPSLFSQRYLVTLHINSDTRKVLRKRLLDENVHEFLNLFSARFVYNFARLNFTDLLRIDS